jgi:hypothetical protein
MPCSDFHEEAVALAQLIAGDADNPPDPTVVLLIEHVLQAAYHDGWLAARMTPAPPSSANSNDDCGIG